MQLGGDPACTGALARCLSSWQAHSYWVPSFLHAPLSCLAVGELGMLMVNTRRSCNATGCSHPMR